MAEVSLRHIEKVYPHAGGKRRAHKAKDGEKKGPNLKVTDEGVLAVEDFNLEVADREFVVLVGPSGCGKSTTLRMVAGLEEISRGELYIDGKLVNDVEPKNRDIAMVFQSYALYPHMTVRGNMEFPLKLRKIPKEDRDKKVEEAAHHAVPRPQAQGALRWPAPARRHRARHRARTEGAPHGRAALQLGCQAP